MTTECESVIDQIAQSVFSTMLNVELVRSEAPGLDDEELLLATAHIVGAWTGSVVLALSPRGALEAAAAMLQVAPAEVTTADQRDVAAELVNMIAGNFKSMLPGPSFLSLPTVFSGRQFGMQVSDAELTEDVLLDCNGGQLQLRVYAKRGTPVSPSSALDT